MSALLRRLCLCLPLLIAFPAHAEEQDHPRRETLDRIVAVVNDEVITQTELDLRARTIKQQLKQNGTALPPDKVLRKQVLERMIIARIQMQQAARSGIRVDDDTLNRAINKIATDNNLTVAAFRSALEQDGYDFTRFREDIRNEIVIARLTQRQVIDHITVSQQEIDNTLTNQKTSGGNSDTEYHLAHILIATPGASTPDDIQKARAKAEKVRADLRAGADFHETAVAVSDGQQALQGGDLGWRKGNELPTFFVDAVSHMQVGDISESLRSPSGFHIIKLIEKRSSSPHIINQTQARHILIRPDEMVTDEETQRRLATLRERVLKGEDFAALARENSQDKATAVNGGDLGWVSPGDLVPRFEEAMAALKPSEISAPFQTGYGWHIVQVQARRTHDDTAQALQTQAREAIRQRKIDEETQTWLQRLRDEAYVENRFGDGS